VILALTVLATPPGWSWYQERMVPSDTTVQESAVSQNKSPVHNKKGYWEKIVAQSPGDTVRLDYVYNTSRIGLLPFDRTLILQDPLPVEKNTPLPIRRLLLHPTRENARKYISWVTAMMLRAYVFAQVVKDVGREYGIEDFLGVSVRTANDSLAKRRLHRLRALEKRFLLMVFVDPGIFSRQALENLKFALDVEGLTLPVVVVHREPLDEKIRSFIPYWWKVKYDEGEYQYFQIQRVPTVLALDMKEHKVHYIARVPVPAEEFRKRLENILFEEGEPLKGFEFLTGG